MEHPNKSEFSNHMEYLDSDKFSKWDKSIPYYGELQDSVIGGIPTDPQDELRVLDLGIGRGGTAIRLFEKFPKLLYWGIDNDERSIEIARNELKEHSEQVLDLQCGNIQTIPFEENFFESVTAVLTIHHLTDDEKESLFAKVKKALKPGGVFLIGDLMKIEDPELNKKAVDEFNEYRKSVLTDGELNKIAEHVKNVPHIIDSIANIKAMLEKAGFLQVDILWEESRLAIIRAAA